MTNFAGTPLTQREIADSWHCAVVGCDHTSCQLTFRGRCHPEAATDVVYLKARGVLSIKCERCQRVIADIAVAL